MTHYHIFWTKPHLGRQRGNLSMELLDFEALTWIASALEIRKHSPMHLLTDSTGKAFFKNSGLAWIYDEISTALDDIPEDIDPAVFWDGAKMFAFQWISTPCVIIDYDAILWREFRPEASVMALHEESRHWSFYATNKERFGPYGFDNGDWNWIINPVNTAFVYFEDETVPRHMGPRSVQFMRDYSADLRNKRAKEAGTSAVYNRATLFAGQRLLPMCAAQVGREIRPLTRLDDDLVTVARNPDCMHLWISKALYRCCPEARAAYSNYLIERLLKQQPECRGSLSKLGLDQPREPDPEDTLDYRKLSHTDLRRQKLKRFSLVEGDVWIEDANLPARRLARTGSLLLPGERVHRAAGSDCEIEPAEKDLQEALTP